MVSICSLSKLNSVGFLSAKKDNVPLMINTIVAIFVTSISFMGIKVNNKYQHCDKLRLDLLDRVLSNKDVEFNLV